MNAVEKELRELECELLKQSHLVNHHKNNLHGFKFRISMGLPMDEYEDLMAYTERKYLKAKIEKIQLEFDIATLRDELLLAA